MTRRSGALIAFTSLAALSLLILCVSQAGPAGRHIFLFGRQAQVRTVPASLARNRPAPDWGDRFGDGTPDILRLTDPADQAAFRRWFTLIAEYQAVRPAATVPPEIADCASLLRYSYREALKRHDENWLMTSGIDVPAAPGEIRAWNYPHSPAGHGTLPRATRRF